jgi:hypothetical protein
MRVTRQRPASLTERRPSALAPRPATGAPSCWGLAPQVLLLTGTFIKSITEIKLSLMRVTDEHTFLATEATSNLSPLSHDHGARIFDGAASRFKTGEGSLTRLFDDTSAERDDAPSQPGIGIAS